VKTVPHVAWAFRGARLLVAFLASDESSLITAEEHVIDSGMVAW
jgi:hypothetical protein